jgi:hypothetical protein
MVTRIRAPVPALPLATKLMVIVAMALPALIGLLVPIVAEVAMVLPIPVVLQITPVLPGLAQVVTVAPDVPILPVAIVPLVPTILSVVATILAVTLRLPVLPLALALPVRIPWRVARALSGCRRGLSRRIARSVRVLCVRERHCRCERRADGHRQEGIVLHDTSFFADQQRSTIFAII